MLEIGEFFSLSRQDVRGLKCLCVVTQIEALSTPCQRQEVRRGAAILVLRTVDQFSGALVPGNHRCIFVLRAEFFFQKGLEAWVRGHNLTYFKFN